MPGVTDPMLVKRLCGIGRDGRSVPIQSPNTPFIPNISLFDKDLMAEKEGCALRIFSRWEVDGYFCGMIGLWNVKAGDAKVGDVQASFRST